MAATNTSRNSHSLGGATPRRSRALAILAGTLLLAALSTGCVRRSTYDKALARQAATKDLLSKCLGDVGAARAQLETTQGKLAQSEADITNTKADLEKERKSREHSEKLLANLQTNLNATRTELEAIRRQRAEAERRLAAWKQLTARFQKMVDSGKIKVYIREGKMMLNLPSEVLFESGRADLAPAGQDSLREVAAILKEFPDREFLVAGHTDNLPLKGKNKKFKDNWELSSARALAVTAFLISEGVNPENLGAAGYGEFDPVGNNAAADGRAENRRIELILLPNLEELPALTEPGEGEAAPAPAPAPQT